LSTSADDKYKDSSGGFGQGQGLSPLDQAAEQWAMNIWTKDDSRSVIRLAPDCIQRAMLELPEDLRNKSEGDLREMYKNSSKQRLTAVDNQIRLSFWLEYDRVQREMLPKMMIGHIVRGIMAYDYFIEYYLKNQFRVAFLTLPPQSYTTRLNEMLDTGLDQIRATLDVPHIVTDSRGRETVNTKLLELKFKIMTYVDMRQNGAIAQRVQIEQKNLNVNMKGDAKDIMKAIEGTNMAALDKKLAELRRKQLMMERGVHPDKADVSTEAILISDEGSKDGTKPESEEQS
jgi:hypothetical protein